MADQKYEVQIVQCRAAPWGSDDPLRTLTPPVGHVDQPCCRMSHSYSLQIVEGEPPDLWLGLCSLPGPDVQTNLPASGQPLAGDSSTWKAMVADQDLEAVPIVSSTEMDSEIYQETAQKADTVQPR